MGILEEFAFVQPGKVHFNGMLKFIKYLKERYGKYIPIIETRYLWNRARGERNVIEFSWKVADKKFHPKVENTSIPSYAEFKKEDLDCIRKINQYELKHHKYMNDYSTLIGRDKDEVETWHD